MKKTAIMHQDRITKGAVRYIEIEDENGPSISQSYLRKDFLRQEGYNDDTWPEFIKVTIEPVHNPPTLS